MKKKGFTLIELLVVIAIIGILAAMVLVALNAARTRARASRVRSDIAQMRARAEDYYSGNTSYNGLCGNLTNTAEYTDMTRQLGSNNSPTGWACGAGNQGYAVSVNMPTNNGADTVCISSGGTTTSGQADTTNFTCNGTTL